MVVKWIKAFAITFLAGLLVLAAVSYLTVRLDKRLRSLWVTTAMQTMSHQWLARLVASDEEIAAIIEENSFVEVEGGQILDMVEPRRSAAPNESGDKADAASVPRPNENAGKKYADYTELTDGIYIKDVKFDDFAGKIMLVEDPSRLVVGMTRTPDERGDLIKTMVPNNGGIAGLNGGWFADPNYEGSGGSPLGYVIKGGELVYGNDDFTQNVAGFNKDGILMTGRYTPEEAMKAGILEGMVTYPILVMNGEGVIKSGDGGWGVAPRSAIGQLRTGEVLLLAIDGRQLHSLGATLKQVQDVLLKNGCVTGVCLDGGSSTVLYHDGDYMNKPALGHERYIPTCWVVKKAL